MMYNYPLRAKVMATGSTDMDVLFSGRSGVELRPHSLRVHFGGSVKTRAPLVVSLMSPGNDEYAFELFTVDLVGVGNDVNLVWPGEFYSSPSGWLLSVGDGIRVQWTNPSPGDITWGTALIVGR